MSTSSSIYQQLQHSLRQLHTLTLSPARRTAFSVSLGVAVLGLLAIFFKRRRHGKPQKKNVNQNNKTTTGKGYPMSPREVYVNGDLPSNYLRYTDSPGSLRSSLRQQKSLSGSLSSLGGASSVSTITHPVVDTSNMSSIQLCQLGFETLQQAIIYWEDGLMKLSYNEDQSTPALLDPETAALQQQLDHLLDSAYRMIDSYERRLERHADQVAFDSAIQAFTEVDRMSEKTRSMDAGSLSDQDSFVSATDMANLSDLDNHRELFQHLPLYEAGLLELKHGSITCRTLRTEMTQCLSDTEFLAKLHGIRLALNTIFQKELNREYFQSMGRKLLSDLLTKTDKDPEEFQIAYDAMMDFVSIPDNWTKMEEELRGRGVKCLTFYDIVLDFILMDAFDDLENPPSSVITVIQNRWLSNGFKETALSTAVWSVLKAKRRMLKFSDGFISQFYSVSEHISPILAWGFLGPESDLKDLCVYFKEVVLGFIRDMFSFEKCRYTSVEELAEDIVRLAKQRSEEAAVKLS